MNRYVLSSHSEDAGWMDYMTRNLDLAKSFFSILDEQFHFEGVNARTFEIMVRTPTGILPFEYLSSGFKSTYTLLLGCLKEIEYRNLAVAADDFGGVIMIDEIELHLHPTWQQKIGSILKRAFPNAQVIATTHSPHVIQSASTSEVIALGRSADDDVFVRRGEPSRFGYSGWSLEEILEDVMGVADTKSVAYRSVLKQFDEAVDRQDFDSMQEAKVLLKEMLHPSSHIRKIIELASAPVQDRAE
nr:AAA family ATPase [Sphingobium sp. 15-1]